MKKGYETSEVRQSQVDFAASGAEIFCMASTALALKLPRAYEDKPLNSLVFHFDRVYEDCQFPMLPDEVKSESLVISVTDPTRIDEYDFSGKNYDIFIHRALPEGVKRNISDEVKRASQKTISGGEGGYYNVPAYAITTQFKMQYRSGKKVSVDSTLYRPSMGLLICGSVFATDVVEYMRTETYQKFPASLPEIEKTRVAEVGGITHSANISFATHPPLNGKEPKEWLEKYADWLRQSIDKMTFGQDTPDTGTDFRGLSDSAMDDGIMLIQTLEAIKRAG